jgi:dihydroorotate dehydrogenase electron transfer subunit
MPEERGTRAGPVHVQGEVVATRRVGAYRHLTLSAPGIPERFRAGAFVAVTVAGHVARRPLWVHRVRASSAFGPTLDVVVEVRGSGTAWLAAQPVGTRVATTGPLGRPFALPKDAVSCLLVGEGYAAAPLFPLAERLRERGCAVSLVVSAPDEAHLLSALEARRSARSVTVLTADGSVGQRGGVPDHVDELVGRSEADVVYAAGPAPVLRSAAAAAERAGAWSQVAVEVPTPCGTGLCHGCPLPVIGEDGVDRVVRACTEGPVVRGDRVRWDSL